MNNRDEIASLKAEIAYLRSRVMMLESQRINAQPVIYHVPVPVPTPVHSPWQPPWGQTYCTISDSPIRRPTITG